MLRIRQLGLNYCEDLNLWRKFSTLKCSLLVGVNSKKNLLPTTVSFMPLFSFKHCIGSSQGERVSFHETLAELRETSYFPIFLLLLQIKEWIKETSLDTILLGDTKIGKPTSSAFILLYTFPYLPVTCLVYFIPCFILFLVLHKLC